MIYSIAVQGPPLDELSVAVVLTLTPPPPPQVSELQGQLLRCHRLLEGCPALNHTPEQQAALLGRKREELKQKR